MKKNKRIISLALALVLMFSFMALSASAAVPEEDMIEPCAHACDCGGLYTAYVYRYSDWKSVDDQECIFGGTEPDIVQRRYKYKDLVCNNSTCGSVYSTTTTQETRIVCPEGLDD